MVTEFKFPDVGEGITEGQLVKWLVKEGERVKQDQSLAEVETDKAIVEIPSPAAGTILKLHAKEGAIIKVGDVIVTIGEKGEKVAETKKIQELPKEELTKDATEKKLIPKGVLATIKVRKLAEKLDVDLSQVHGTGFLGGITEDDVREYCEKKKVAEIKLKKNDYLAFGKITEVVMSNVRKKISEHMTLSKQKIPHVTYMDEADISALVEVREKEKSSAEKKGIRLTLLPFIAKAVIIALKEHPFLNASLDEDNNKIILKKYYNLGIATDTGEGLIVPNIKKADKMSVVELAKEIDLISEKAKSRKLILDDLKGGSFTITNIGSIGGRYFTPVINYPEVAILGVGKMMQRTRVINGKIDIKYVMPFSLSFDHRVVDGAEAARFMNVIIKHLGDPNLLLVDLK